jgi:cytochrome c oxidase assembly factor CtaG
LWITALAVAAGQRAYARGVPYDAIAPLTAETALSSWMLEPVSAVLVIAIGAAYLLGTRRVPGWPAARTAMFVGGGLGSWVFLTMSFIGVYDTTVFWIRAVQTVILLMVTPLFLALGMPVRLLMSAVKPATAARLRGIGHSMFAKAVTFPAVISIVLLTTPFAFFFTSWFDAALDGGIVNDLTHVWLVAVGWAYFWTRLQVDPVPKAYFALVSIGITFAEVIFDGGLGLLLIFGHDIVGLSHYQAVRDWGLSPHSDQIAGGTAFWIIGDLSGLPFLGALFRKWIRDDTEQTIAVDRELDAIEVAAGPAVHDDDGMQAPWWETDPSRVRR